jgi:hypothetical protein
MPVNAPTTRANEKLALPHSPQYTKQKRASAQWFLFALAWPFLAAVLQVKNYRKLGVLSGFIIFCFWAGWVYQPSEGSDAHTYGLYFQQFSTGAYFDSREPFYSLLFWLLGGLGFGVSWYFAIVGLTYAIIVSLIAKKLLREFPVRNIAIASAAFFFLACFFLNQPVFAAINARYHLGLWVMMAATLAALDRRWSICIGLTLLGASIHFGHSIWGLVLLIFYFLSNFKRLGLPLAYAFLFAAFFLPENATIEFAAVVNPFDSSSFGSKLNFYAELAERNAALLASGSVYESAWFLQWFTTPIFYSLLISGHLLSWRIRTLRNSKLYTLWLIIVLMLAFQVALSAEAHTAGRVERNALALLFLWHAMWFLSKTEGARLAIVINFLPAAFYFVVAYRRWLNDANIAAFLPSPFGLFPDYFPSVVRLLGVG